MVESDQAQGENINIYPEVAGPITQILVSEGQQVHRGDALLTHRRFGAARDRRAAASAGGRRAGDARRAEGRAAPEKLAVAAAQVDNARATPQERAGRARQAAALLRARPQIGQPGCARQRPQRREDRRDQSAGRRAAIRAHQGRGLDLRHPESGTAVRGPVEGLRGVRGAAGQIHHPGPGRWRRARPCRPASAATYPRRAPTIRYTQGYRSADRDGDAAGSSRRCAPTSTRSWSTELPDPEQDPGARCSSAAPRSTCR